MAKELTYLAGGMRGYRNLNFPMFHKAATNLRENGVDVWNPAERDEEEFWEAYPTAKVFDPEIWAQTCGHDFAYFMEHDLPQVCRCDTITLLPDWHDSQGARLEARTALECGKTAYIYVPTHGS